MGRSRRRRPPVRHRKPVPPRRRVPRTRSDRRGVLIPAGLAILMLVAIAVAAGRLMTQRASSPPSLLASAFQAVAPWDQDCLGSSTRRE